MATTEWPESAYENIEARKGDYLNDARELTDVAAAANGFVSDLLETDGQDWPLFDSLVTLLESLGCMNGANALRERIEATLV